MSDKVTDERNGSDEDLYNSEQDDSVEETEDEWTPPTREQYEALIADRKRANAESAERKRFLREAGIDPNTGKRKTPENESEESADKVSKADYEAAVRKAKTDGLALSLGVTSALTEAGWNGKNLSRITTKFLDLDAVEIGEDGTLSGLMEQIDALKEDVPEFFRKTRTAPSADAVGAGKKETAPVEPDWKAAVIERFNKGLI